MGFRGTAFGASQESSGDNLLYLRVMRYIVLICCLEVHAAQWPVLIAVLTLLVASPATCSPECTCAPKCLFKHSIS